MEKETILEPMADILIESMRSIGYTFESAMADIIDNSISAKANEINIIFNPSECNLGFIDNGNGMNKEELKEAMRWGSKDPLAVRSEIDLGRFGLGLKSASLSQCRKLTVVSKSENGMLNGMCWDLDHVRDTGKWSVLNLTVDEISKLPNISNLSEKSNGTYVLWEDFDKIEVTSKDLVSTLEELLDYASDYLALVFHLYIADNLTIKINGTELKKIDPFLTKNSFTQVLKADPLSIKDNDGKSHQIKVEPYVLPHFNSLSVEEKLMMGKHGEFRNKQGFYIYRNKRLIIWGSWFRMAGNNEAFKNARVKVQIPNSLDDIWSIDVKKSNASIPPSIKKQLFYAVKNSIDKSKRIYTQRAVNVNKQMGYECVWDTLRDNDKTFYKINRELPVIQKLTEGLSQEQIDMLDMIFVDIENNIPKYEIFNQIANDDDSDNDDYLSVKERVKSFLSLNEVNDIDGFEELINPLLKSEPYCKYENLYNDLKKELFEND